MSPKTFFLACLLVFFCSAHVFASTYGAGGIAARYPIVVPASSINAAARAEIVKQLAAQNETRRHEIKLERGGWDLRAPVGQISFAVAMPLGLVYGRYMPVHVVIEVNGKPYRREICYFTVHVYDKALVATHNLEPEEPLKASDVQLAEREVTETQKDFLQNPSEIIGNVVNRIVREGMPLTSNMLRGPIIIEAGHPVTIVARRGGIEARASGVALSRGRKGDLIRVRTAKGKPIMAKVLDENTVEVGA